MKIYQKDMYIYNIYKIDFILNFNYILDRIVYIGLYIKMK